MLYYLHIILPWLWVPLSLSLVTVILSIPRYRLQKFFASLDFRGCDGKLPRCVKCTTVNKYLKKVTFKSRIPFVEWERGKANIELFYRRKIHTIEQNRKNLRITDIFFIREELPSIIPWDDSYMVDGRKFAIGESYKGRAVWNAASLAHGLIAGATGGGKTALLRAIIHQAIRKKFNISVLDFKNGGDYAGIEREAYRDLEEGYGQVLVSDPEEARQLLLALVVEVKGRLEHFKELGVTNIDEYNNAGRGHFVPWLLVIDEAAEILDVKPTDKAEKELYAEINQSLRTLARISRAAGVHILMGFIRPSADILDGQIKNNLLWRVCGYFQDPAAARIVLDNDRATELPPEIKGRFIVGDEEVQAYYLPIPSVITGDGE